MRKITHNGRDVEEFFKSYLNVDRRVLFIGTVGFNDVGNYFATLLAPIDHVDFRFFVEKRPEVPAQLLAAGIRNRSILEQSLSGRNVSFADIDIVTDDIATMAGRRAVQTMQTWLQPAYTDIVIDATSMSRGVCFSATRYAVDFCHGRGLIPHIVVAERDLDGAQVRSISSDIACYMHGFQGDMETDQANSALKLWVPQLSENAGPALDRIFYTLVPDEICPVLPFPATTPRRPDDLLVAMRGQLQAWDTSTLEVIYAHESDPRDVCATIERLHRIREDVFKSATNLQTRTILSPSGWRVGSIGMLLAALELDLPVMYTESIGYTIECACFPEPDPSPPGCRWHIALFPPLP